MIEFHPVPTDAVGMLGAGYSLRTGATPVTFRVSAMQPQVQLVLAGGVTQAIGQPSRASHEANETLTVVGRSTSVFDVFVEPHSWIVGVGLQSSAWRHLTGVPADLATDRRLDGSAIWGEGRTRDLRDLALACSDEGAAVTLLSRFLTKQARCNVEIDRLRLRVFDGWLTNASVATVDDLVSALNLSHRQVERLSRINYGASPVFLKRKYRILQLAASAALGRLVLDDAEQEIILAGFADQSHFIRNFREFTGFTPGQYSREAANPARELLIRRWKAGGRTAFNLWS